MIFYFTLIKLYLLILILSFVLFDYSQSCNTEHWIRTSILGSVLKQRPKIVTSYALPLR